MRQAQTVLDTFQWRFLWLTLQAEQKFSSARSIEDLAQLVDDVAQQVAQLRWEYETMRCVSYSPDTDKVLKSLSNFAKLQSLLADIVAKHQQWTASECESLRMRHATLAAVAQRT